VRSAAASGSVSGSLIAVSEESEAAPMPISTPMIASTTV